MASNLALIKDFEPKGNHHFLIDTNILMYLFSPIGSYAEKNQEIISKFLERSRQVNATLITTSSVIGEFFHVNLKMYYDNWRKNQKDQIQFNFKEHYRPTEDFTESVTAINRSIENILKITDRFPDEYNNIKIENVLQHCYHAEFTDSYLLELSNQKGWVIVSNDKDLLNHPSRQNLLVTPNFS